MIRALFLLFLPLASLRASAPNDQVLVLFGSGGYVIYKMLDFANDHGYRYVKILSYEFNAFDHQISGVAKGDRSHGGRYFELKEDNLSITFLCFDEPPEDIYIIDLEKYRPLLDDVQNSGG